MSLRIHLQDSQGSGCKIDARTATLSVSHGVFQIGQGNFLSFLSGEVEVFQSDGNRYFGVGEGFASINDEGISLVTHQYIEFLSPDDIHIPPTSKSILNCVVCEKKLTDTLYCTTVNDTPIGLCCPNCVETFRRASRIVRQADPRNAD